MTMKTTRTSRTRAAAVALATASLLLAGCAGQDPAPSTSESSATSESGASDSGPGGEVSAEHNDTDTRFAQSMVPHHRQAIQMSDVVLAKEGIDERVLILARQIEAAQQPEIDQMIGFLQAWEEEVPADDLGTGGDMNGSDDMGPDDMGPDDMGPDDGRGGAMSGMMSGEEMRHLEGAQGVEAARLFLEQMTRHHEGAVEMAQAELAAGQNPQALELAQAIVDAQEAEIAEMQEILATL